jgi:DNA repair protein RecO (recombination protein O)
MTRVRAVWVEKAGRELHRIEALEGLRSYATMQSEPLLQAACAVLAEVGETYAREDEEDMRSFKLLGAVLDALEAGADALTLVRYFEYWTLRLHGLLPDLTSCSSCSRDLTPGEAPRVARDGVTCDDCGGAGGRVVRRIGRAELRFLEEARRSAPSALAVSPSVVRPGGGLEFLLRGTLESFAERRFRTYRHLTSILAAEAGGGR